MRRDENFLSQDSCSAEKCIQKEIFYHNHYNLFFTFKIYYLNCLKRKTIKYTTFLYIFFMKCNDFFAFYFLSTKKLLWKRLYKIFLEQ